MNAGAKAPTLHDVARAAGVSLATASRSLNGSERKVNEEYRVRVLAAAAELGYTPNLSAQAVAKGTTMTVALLVGDIADPYFSSIAAGVIRASEEAGLIVTMAATERDATRELDLVKALRGQRPRVLILAGSRFAGEETQPALAAELDAFESTGGRVVFISQPELPFDTVLLDNYGGARQLARALVDLGYRRFAAISGSESLLTARDRLTGFMDGLAEHALSIPTEHIVHTEFTRDGGYDAATELLQRGIDEVELVFAVNDVMAVGAMSALREGGRIPGETIALAGYDDIPTVRDVTPALTTVRIPLEDVGRQAVELALAPKSDRETATPIAATVVLRGSTPVLATTAVTD
ncbi:LacI family DNA-binding transcriptional regulator [Glaciibacter superstes]|uniref:LacI family DNA-binding transcriptional regulator n=1 Tax=Glaciibacter superstes TaxID=501023 RepID=UPI0003B70763|nr:LacI family DNA-binding transcriptional regulator [Glaciibacter superstes]